MDKLLLIGGGGHCHATIDVIETEGKFEIAGIVDDGKKIGDEVLGHPVLGSGKDLKTLRKEFEYAFITIGQVRSPEARMNYFKKIVDLNFEIPTLVSPLAYVSKYAQVGRGTIVMHRATINANVCIGENTILNSHSLVEHDSIVESHCHISTGAILNGGTKIRKGTFFGSGAVSKELSESVEFDFIKANSILK